MFYTNDIFDNALKLRDIFHDYFRELPNGAPAEEPLLNLYENGDTIIVKAALPGVKASDLEIELADKQLTIKGERKPDYTDNPYLRRERSFGNFKRTIALPFDVDRDKAAASLADGIFTVTLEKSESAKARKIEIK